MQMFAILLKLSWIASYQPCCQCNWLLSLSPLSSSFSVWLFNETIARFLFIWIGNKRVFIAIKRFYNVRVKLGPFLFQIIINFPLIQYSVFHQLCKALSAKFSSVAKPWNMKHLSTLITSPIHRRFMSVRAANRIPLHDLLHSWFLRL